MSDKVNIIGSSRQVPVTTQITLNYLREDQARQLLEMFDSEEEYSRNFAAIKAITRSFIKNIHQCGGRPDPKIGKMFTTVNNMQDILLPEKMTDIDRIMSEAGL